MHSGIMHQIRVHAAFCGLTLDGDALYGSQNPAPISLVLLYITLALNT